MVDTKPQLDIDELQRWYRLQYLPSQAASTKHGRRKRDMTLQHEALIKKFLEQRKMDDQSGSRDFKQTFRNLYCKAQGFFGRLLPFGIQLVVSSASYGSGIVFIQLLGTGLRISCANRVLGPCLGAVGVGAASALSGHMTRHVKRQLSSGKDLRQALSTPFWDEIDVTEALLDAVSGVAIFKLYGGSFRRLLPSDLREPGAFAYQSVPLSAGQHASESQKGQLISIFKRDGCHHCGSKAGGVIGDHIPPTKMVKDALAKSKSADASMKHLRDFVGQLFPSTSLKQSYYAQCRRCSQSQAQLMRHEKRSALKIHRWLVAPGLTPGILVGFRQYFPANGGTMGLAALPLASASAAGSCKPAGKEQAKEGHQRRSLWSWVSPMVEEVQPGPDVYCSLEAKGLPLGPAASGHELLQPGQ